MKKFLGFLVDLFVILLELAICAFLVFWLISKYPPCPECPNPLKIRGIDTLTLVPTWSPKPNDTLTPTLPLGKLNIPPVFWMPEHFAPEKQWGYDRVYSCTRLERVPGFWHIPGSQLPTFPYDPVYIFDECAIPYF